MGLKASMVIEGKRYNFGMDKPGYYPVGPVMLEVTDVNDRQFGFRTGPSSIQFSSPEVRDEYHVCRSCQGLFSLAGTGQCKELDRMKEKTFCFHCAYWDLVVENPTDLVVVDHTVYKIGTGNGGGMGGRRFDIEFLDDGRTVWTNDLWHRGTLPPNFWDKLPDNARFLGGAARVELPNGTVAFYASSQ